jgi:hypothetical protein
VLQECHRAKPGYRPAVKSVSPWAPPLISTCWSRRLTCCSIGHSTTYRPICSIAWAAPVPRSMPTETIPPRGFYSYFDCPGACSNRRNDAAWMFRTGAVRSFATLQRRHTSHCIEGQLSLASPQQSQFKSTPVLRRSDARKDAGGSLSPRSYAPYVPGRTPTSCANCAAVTAGKSIA